MNALKPISQSLAAIGLALTLSSTASASTDYNCSDPRRDNDEMALVCQGQPASIDIEDNLHQTGPRRVFLSYREVMERFTPYIESQFDAFIIANTAVPKVSGGRVKNDVGLVAPQHIMIVRKKNDGSSLFVRDSYGIVRDVDWRKARAIDRAGRVPYTIKTSSGANHHMRSFSGIFHVNHRRSQAMNSTARRTNFEMPMSNALYFGYIYTDSAAERRRSRTSDPRVSYAAMHGTPSANIPLLGRQRASHGCLRIRPEIASRIFPAVMEMDGRVPNFDWLNALPTRNLQNAGWRFGDRIPTHLPMVSGKKVLFIVFNGHGEGEHSIPREWGSIDI